MITASSALAMPPHAPQRENGRTGGTTLRRDLSFAAAIEHRGNLGADVVRGGASNVVGEMRVLLRRAGVNMAKQRTREKKAVTRTHGEACNGMT